MSDTPEYVLKFAEAVYPDTPELMLSTATERSILTEATCLIKALRAELLVFQAERDRLIDLIQRLYDYCPPVKREFHGVEIVAALVEAGMLLKKEREDQGER